MRRTHIIVLAAGLMLAGFAHVSTPSVRAGAWSATHDAAGRQVHLFNTQLASTDELGLKLAPSPAWGHVQLKLTELETGEFMPAWKGRLFNPGNEPFAFGGLIAAIDEDGLPAVGDEILSSSVVLTFFSEADASCDVLEFESGELTADDYLPAEVGLAAIINPDILVGIFVTPDATGVFGRFGPSTPEVSENVERDDLKGRIVRCAG